MRRLLLVVLLLLAGCGDDGGSGGDAADEHGHGGPESTCRTSGFTKQKGVTHVEVALDEWSVVPSPATVPAGPVAITAANDGALLHEVVVVRADSIQRLPVTGDGILEESSLPRGSVIGAIEPFDPDQTCAATFRLTPGRYVLLCNLVDEEVHLARGMAVVLTVT